jgi:hypothetical protein
MDSDLSDVSGTRRPDMTMGLNDGAGRAARRDQVLG